MKATDLYIGKTYHSVKFNRPVILTAEDLSELVHRADGALIDSYIETIIKPIPLYKDQLKKLGATDKGILVQSSNYPNGDLFIGCNEGSTEVYLMNCSDGYRFGKEIKYVHQLQNLYQALTSKQLKYKEDRDSKISDMPEKIQWKDKMVFPNMKNIPPPPEPPKSRTIKEGVNPIKPKESQTVTTDELRSMGFVKLERSTIYEFHIYNKAKVSYYPWNNVTVLYMGTPGNWDTFNPAIDDYKSLKKYIKHVKKTFGV